MSFSYEEHIDAMVAGMIPVLRRIEHVGSYAGTADAPLNTAGQTRPG